MKTTTLQAALGSAALFWCAQAAGATHSHRHVHDKLFERHSHTHHADGNESHKDLAKRATCTLPDHPDLVRVPGAMNNGFAMSPDQACVDGGFCPIACVPGKVMSQWKPGTTYVYPESMDGGLYCNGGVPQKPFPDQPYCVDGTHTVSGENDCSQVISFCQTVLPGNEAMLIPTDIQPGQTVALAVPGPSYWDGTAAHYYVNGPGVPASVGCQWGSDSTPVGNWAPYVAGANTDSSGKTYVKLGWNPVWVDSGLSKTMPTYGLRIECPNGGCNGMPCSIDPTKDGINGVTSLEPGTGDGAKFCVATVDAGKSAVIVVFETNGSKAPSAPPSSQSSSVATAPQPSSSHPAPSPSSSAASSSSPSSSSSLKPSSSSSTAPSSSSSKTYPTVLPGVFHENSTYSTGAPKGSGSGSARTSPATSTVAAANSSSTGDASGPAPSVSKSEGAADQGGTAIAGLIVAIVAAAALY